MNSLAIFSGCTESRLLLSSPILRRQLFLIRTFGAYCCRVHMDKNQTEASGKTPALEVDAESVIRDITPVLDPKRHKGQAGKIAVIGGCREYTGAPYFAAISALKIGADLSHVFCTKDAAPVIKGYSPELIVHPILVESYGIKDDEKASISKKVLSEVAKWMERFDCLVVGPGLGRDLFFWIDGVTILRKGKSDLISNGDTVHKVGNFGSPRRCGGQGDILSGSVAVFSSWARSKYNELPYKSALSPMVLGCIAGSSLLRRAASLAFLNKKRSTLTSDIIDCLGKSLEDISPAE